MAKVENMLPLALGTQVGTNWSPVGAATLLAAVFPGDPPATDSTYATINNPNQNKLSFTLRNKPNDIRTVTSLVANLYCLNADNPSAAAVFKVATAFAATIATESNITGVVGTKVLQTATLARPGGGDWTREDIAQPDLELVLWASTFGPNSPTSHWDIYEAWIALTYEPIPAQIGSARDIPSRRLWAFSRPEIAMRRRLSLADGLSFDLLQPVQVSHARGPHDTDDGWREARWKRRLMIGLESVEDPNTNTVEWLLRDMRPVLCLYRDTAWALTSAAPWAEGVGRFSRRGRVSRTFTRASRAWVPDPADGRIVQIEPDQEKLAQNGLLLEGERSNLLIESAFRNGAADTFTGWTKTATGGNTVTDGDELWWDAGLVGRSARFLYLAASSADVQLASTATASQAADTHVTVSIAHYDPSGEALYWTLQRSIDSWYWDEAGGSWGASIAWNPLTVSSSGYTRHQAGAAIDVGGGATTLTAWVGVPDALGVDGQINYCAHVQIEVGDYMTSPILTEALAYTRVADSLSISNNLDGESYSYDRGAFTCQVIPGWTAAEIGDTNKTIFYMELDSDNYDWGYYDGTNDRFVWERSRAAVVTRAFLAYSPTKGEVIDLVFRHTGPEGELELTTRTKSIFVDGVKGTDG